MAAVIASNVVIGTLPRFRRSTGFIVLRRASASVCRALSADSSILRPQPSAPGAVPGLLLILWLVANRSLPSGR